MSRFDAVKDDLRRTPRTWLVTGAAGFIGSNLVEQLLALGQTVVGLDNFATGHRHNLTDVLDGAPEWKERFRFIEGDIRDADVCRSACEGVDYVLHQAALGSVPRSIENPIASHEANVDGFLNMLTAARDAGVRRFVYASSSSVYGDHPGLPKVEEAIGQPLSPYAATKAIDEIYADVFARTYDLQSVGLRYFNVFGRRQDPNGAYAAVIPKWIGQLLGGETCRIYGDGETSRDFCYIDNVLQANLLAATSTAADSVNQVYNVAYGDRTTLNQLFDMLSEGLADYRPELRNARPVHDEFRPGDVRHSLASIDKIVTRLGYEPTASVAEGLQKSLRWYVENIALAGASY